MADPDQPRNADVPAERERQRLEVTIPAHVRRSRPNHFKGVVNGMEPEKRAYRFGMWCMALMAMDIPKLRYQRGGFDQALQYFENNWTPRRSAAAMGENDTTGGQFLVPDEFGQDMITLREIFGVARRIMKTVPMMSDTRTDPRRKSGLTAYFTAESAAGTESNKQWDQVRLTAKDLMVLSRYTNQLSADSVISIGDDLAGEISYAFANKEDDCGFNGDGTSTYGGIIGVRSKLTNANTPGSGTDSAGLYRISGTGWSSFVLSDFNAVAGLLPQYADTNNAVWVCHRNFYYSIMQKLELAAGGVSAREVAEGDRRPRPLFLGYPVEFSQIWPSATATASVVAALGDFQKGASFGDRQQDAIAFSEHASIGGQSVFEQNQIAIRGTERFDINVHDAGSSTVAGPIVGLATHS